MEIILSWRALFTPALQFGSDFFQPYAFTDHQYKHMIDQVADFFHQTLLALPFGSQNDFY
jgi:hypothetical protein